jgi:formate dehydrogenase subunit gamma
MRYGHRWPLSARTGATFVHDWLAAAVAVVVIGHLHFASRDRDARRGMRTGVVPAAWAEREHRGWAAELRGAGAGTADAGTADTGTGAGANTGADDVGNR